jgi:hypothetical protein
MLKSRDAGSDTEDAPHLNFAEMPYPQALDKLFAPLVEVSSDCDVGDNRICRLYHSAVLDFLCKNTQVLSNSQTPGLEIGPKVIADACLLYLFQPRYSRLLTKSLDSGQWFDLNNHPVAEQQFLTYSAKYWDKHLDRFQGARPLRVDSKDFQDRVMKFLKSLNFQTCLQVQSLWVAAHFGTFTVKSNSGFYKRVLPDWLRLASEITDWNMSYYAFWNEWKRFLDCGTSNRLNPILDPCKGEIDRCWWAALGRENFLSKMNSRYITFRLETEGESGHWRRYGFEELSEARDEVSLSVVVGLENLLSKMDNRYITFSLEEDGESGLGRRNGWEGVSESGDELKILRLK